MAWFSGKVSLGNFPDLAGAVNKLSESVKNIEKNFDNALGLEEKADSTSSSEASGLWPVMSWHKSEDRDAEPKKSGSPQKSSEVEGKGDEVSAAEPAVIEEGSEVVKREKDDDHAHVTEKKDDVISEPGKMDSEFESQNIPSGHSETVLGDVKTSEPVDSVQEKESLEVVPAERTESVDVKSEIDGVGEAENVNIVHDESHDAIVLHDNQDGNKIQADGTVNENLPVEAEVSSSAIVLHDNQDGNKIQADETVNENFPVEAEVSSSAIAEVSPNDRSEISSGEAGVKIDMSGSQPDGAKEADMAHEISLPTTHHSVEDSNVVSELVSHESEVGSRTTEEIKQINDGDFETKEQRLSSVSNTSDSLDSIVELEKVKKEMKMMEKALQGAARQAQAKADEIAKLMNENEQLKIVIEDLKRKSSDAEIESLREEYHQRVANLERKVYALTKERDTLRREQNKKSDAAALLKEKDEIINQIMAEGEELSKKQAAQESTIRKLRAQVRELEEEKKGLMTKLQVEENKVESIRKDKAATEKLLQETIEKHQAELATQKEYYTSALAAAKEAEALAEARANNEARTELESRLREAEERESMLVQALEELRQTLSQKEQQAVLREDALHKDIEDLQKRCQESERRCEELISQVPESTRPLLRQIEAMQEAAASRAEAWNAVERSLNFRLQEEEAKAAAAEERERSVNERLSQTLSRINVLEAQISCLRAEQTQLNRSLEKERQRAAENRQDYLAVKEEADTQAGRAHQLEEEIKELRRKHKQELQDALMHRELIQQELEREKAARLDLEKTAHVYSNSASDQPPLARSTSAFENGTPSRKLSTTSSLGSMEESYFLQSSLDASDSFSERRNPGEATMSPYYMKSMTPSAFESALRQKEGELASYMSRLASMESIRDSLAEELVQLTAQCEKLRAEAALLPGIRAELDALRRRHSAALELMGERDEELEELRADIVDLKEMYREQVNLLVNKVQVLSSSMGNTL